jgi:hypothetical protein
LLLAIIEIDQIKLNQIEKCVAILNLKLDIDKLFDEMINSQMTFKKVIFYREPLFIQKQKYIADHDVEKQILDEKLNASDDDEQFFHKTTIHHQKIRSDRLWAFLIEKTTIECDEIRKLVPYVYSITCFNAFTEGIFSYINH